ncbi:MAG: hypothetical protein M3T56_01600 [Chloroflexota bacterium]|nr:hypothetical protein [Chloroflexota bacterium]
MFQSQLEKFLFAGTPLTPRSKTVMTQRILESLKRRGLIAATQRLSFG